MSYVINRETYTQNTITNTETGVTLTQWDRVTIGKSKNAWDIAEILHDGQVRLHRQIPAKVGQRGISYRIVSMDRLTPVTEDAK